MEMNLKIFFLVLLTAPLAAQPAIQWQTILGGSQFDEAKSILQTNDGGYIVAGDTYSFNGDVVGSHGATDFWVVKLSDSGAVQWKKAFGGESNDAPHSILQTNDGGYIVAGTTQSEQGQVTGNHGWNDAWVIKLSSTGDLEWQRAYGGSGWEEAHSIQQTTDGGYIFAGIAELNNGEVTGAHGGLDYWVVKISDVGEIEWQKTFGGSSEDIANSIKQTTDGGFVIAGSTQSSDGDVIGNHGNEDFWVIKLSNTGELQWQKPFGGNSLDFAREIHQTEDGGYVVAGVTGSHNSGDVSGHGVLSSLDCWVAKLSSSGQLQWQKAFGGSQPDYAFSMVPTNDGMYIVAGHTISTDGDVLDNDGGRDAWIVKLSGSGNIVWQKTIGGTLSDEFFSIKQTSDSGYIMAGFAWSSDGDVSGTVHGYNDFWIVKLAPETVGVETAPDGRSGALEIFPNPANQSVYLNVPSGASSLQVNIYDLLGQQISQQRIENGEALTLTGLQSGLYMLVAREDSGKAWSGKLRRE
jgi:Secretion system C-terminal sorting domain